MDEILKSPWIWIGVGVLILASATNTDTLKKWLDKIVALVKSWLKPKPPTPVVPTPPVVPDVSAAIGHYIALKEYCKAYPESQVPLAELWKCLDPNKKG